MSDPKQRRTGGVLLGAAAGLAVLLAGPAAAKRVFFDDFDSEANGKTAIFQTTLSNFEVAGYIDIIAPDNRLGYAVDSSVIDIGGGLTGGAIRNKDWYRWEAGDTVSVSFLISGNQLRPDIPDIPYFELQFLVEGDENGYKWVDVERFWADGWLVSDFGPERLGDYYFMYGTELAGNQPWVRQTLNFIPLKGGSVRFLLGTLTGGGYGPLIDDFAIDITPAAAAIPEPECWAMLIIGFGAVGIGLRRRRDMTAGRPTGSGGQ
jgi:hypothetical protein